MTPLFQTRAHNGDMNELRILLIADDPLVRAGLAALLADEPACAIVMQLASHDPSLADAPNLARADVALWDLGWSVDDDFDALRDFVDSGTPTAVLLPDAEYAGQVWSTGARGMMLRDAPGAQLPAGLTALAQGLVVVDPELARALPVNRLAEEDALVVEPLTPRELDVLQLLAEGAANKEIARRLEISEHTVKYHVNAILSKLSAQSRTEAVVRATRAGLILL
jgi:two-component system nitrate/nitrite response regulator NarL